jgi:alkylated DNA nucleotide flippase Atl1
VSAAVNAAVSGVAAGEVAAVGGIAAVAGDAKAHRETQSAVRKHPLPRRRAVQANSQPAHPLTARTSTITSRLQ